MCIGATLFFIVVLGVWYLVLKNPTNLTFGERSHLEHEKLNFGTEKGKENSGSENTSL